MQEDEESEREEIEKCDCTYIGNNKTRLCKTCAKNFSIEIDDNGAITSLASSFAAPEEPADEPAA